jgi:hypothetical protein
MEQPWMYTNVNLVAPVGVLAFLGTAFVLFVAGLLLIYSLVRRKFTLTRWTLLAMAIVAATYFSILLVFSFASSEQVLARGQEKYFCEIDCHLAYSIVDVTQSKTLGNAPTQVTARGSYSTITIKTRFDETTISRNRGDALLNPNSRAFAVIDENGKKYFPFVEGQRVLEQAKGVGTPITTPLRPGQSYKTTLVFDLPTDIRNPTLLVNEGDWVTHFIIGHENSPLHKKTRFQI